MPDLDRTDHLLILGANPMASNGSLMTAPDMRGRLRAIRARGGKVVVIDPRRTRTADEADEHHFIRPGTDALLLIGARARAVRRGPRRPGRARRARRRASTRCASSPPASRPSRRGRGDRHRGGRHRAHGARARGRAERAAVYGRIGTTTQRFGTTASWLVDVLNVLTGNLDRPGGAMFTKPAAGSANTSGEPGRGRGVQTGRCASRVRGLPETLGELPVAVLAEEIETPGEGQIRALITIAGNPAAQHPEQRAPARGARDARLHGQHRHLPQRDDAPRRRDPPGAVAARALPLRPRAATRSPARNVANYSPTVFEREAGMLEEWETMLRLVGIATGQGPNADIAAIDDYVGAARRCRRGERRSREALLAELAPRRRARAPARPRRCAPAPYGLTLADLEAAPHGIDLGALEPRVPEILRTPSGKIELAPPQIVADVERLRAALGRARATAAWSSSAAATCARTTRGCTTCRRWSAGPARCTAHVHPDDAARLGLADGEDARVSSRARRDRVPVEVTEDVMPGVVSIPHGWGHDARGHRDRRSPRRTPA